MHGTFVQQLVRAVSDLGVNCNVISPLSLFDLRYGKFDPYLSQDSTGEFPVKVYRPRYISFSNKQLLNYNSVSLTQASYNRAIKRTLASMPDRPGVLFGHFLYPSGAAVVEMASMLGILSIVAVGEGTFWTVEPFGYPKAIQDFRNASGLIPVSNVLKRSLMTNLNIPEEKIRVMPNGVNRTLFSPRDRSAMRRRFGFPEDKFIIAFNGHFDENKGPHRLLAAVRDLDNIGLIFMGEGELEFDSPDILFKGVVQHAHVPELLSAADIFVLPTMLEGSCNAIIEALACGLPVVTSEGEFNDDIVDDNVAIRIDPSDVVQIRTAILSLYRDEQLRKKMSSNALAKIKNYDLTLRASNILAWIKEMRNGSTKDDDLR